jgi:hypothetical protein
MARYVLLVSNLISLLLSVICFLSIAFHPIPPSIPDTIINEANGMSKDQVINKLVTANATVDHAYNLLWFFLFWWIGISLFNFAVLIFTLLSKSKPSA